MTALQPFRLVLAALDHEPAAGVDGHDHRAAKATGRGIEAARVHEDWCPCNDKNIHHAHIAAAD